MVYVILLLVTLVGQPNDNPVLVWHSSTRVAHESGVYFWSSDMGVVYLARNKVNGKGYVGKTTGLLRQRRWSHECRARRESVSFFHRALRKYGFDAFEWKVLMTSDDEDDLNESEIALIRLFKSKAPGGYNLSDGGEGQKGWNPSLEWRTNRSEFMKGNKYSEGTTPSIETRLKISRAGMGRTHSIATKAKLSKINKGRIVSLAARAKSSKVQKGRKRGPQSADHSAKIAKALMGHSVSLETRAKISEAKKGQKVSVETKRKISETQKKRFRKNATN